MDVSQRTSLAANDRGPQSSPSGFESVGPGSLVGAVLPAAQWIDACTNCADCGVSSPEHPTFAGEAVCDRCEARRISLAMRLHAAVLGFTPEEVTGFIVDGFPVAVKRDLVRPHVWAEAVDHVSLLLCRVA